MTHLFVLGAGHVGLTTAVGFARLGHAVTVADIDCERIADLQGGRPPSFEPGMAEAVVACQDVGALRFTNDLVPPVDAAVSFVCVATPTGPDGPLFTGHVESALRGLLDGCPPDHVIVVRSTLPLDGPAKLRRVVGTRQTRPAV